MSTTTLVRPAPAGPYLATAVAVPRTTAPLAPLRAPTRPPTITTTPAPAPPQTVAAPPRTVTTAAAGTDTTRLSPAPPQPAVRTEVPWLPTRWDPVRFTGPAAPPPPVPKGSPLVAASALATAARGTPPALPPAGPWAAALARCAVEVLVGLRPATQLMRYLTTDLYESLARRADLAGRILGRPARSRHTAVRRVHLCQVGPRTVEASVVVHDGVRIRAAAVRLEAHHGRWRATALEIG
jgi:hypothetical protein